MKNFFFIVAMISILLITGCSSNSVVKDDPIIIPGIADSINLTVIDPDIWIGPIENEKGDSIGSLAVNPKSKKAFIKTKIDTIRVPVPFEVEKYQLIEKIVDLLPWWAKMLYGLIIGLTTALFTYLYLRFGRGK